MFVRFPVSSMPFEIWDESPQFLSSLWLTLVKDSTCFYSKVSQENVPRFHKFWYVCSGWKFKRSYLSQSSTNLLLIYTTYGKNQDLIPNGVWPLKVKGQGNSKGFCKKKQQKTKGTKNLLYSKIFLILIFQILTDVFSYSHWKNTFWYKGSHFFENMTHLRLFQRINYIISPWPCNLLTI